MHINPALAQDEGFCLIPLDHRAELGCLLCFCVHFWGEGKNSPAGPFSGHMISHVDQMKEIPKCSRIHDIFEYVLGEMLNNNQIGEFHRHLSVKIRHIMSFRPGTRCINFKLSCHIVDGRNPVPVEVGSLSHYLQGLIHPRWLFGISEPSTVCIPQVFAVEAKSLVT